LKDEESARKLFYSNTFDFTGMGPQLIKRLLKELQSSIGFYEVQTGQSIGQVICTLLPAKLGWLENAIATALGVAALKFDFNPWLQARQIGVSDHAAGAGLDRRWFGLLALRSPATTSPKSPMLPLLKKKTEAASATSQMPAWHPSFRNYERLPDIKVVRTVFFVNAVAITVAIAMFTVFIFKEYHLYSLRRQVADVRAQLRPRQAWQRPGHRVVQEIPGRGEEDSGNRCLSEVATAALRPAPPIRPDPPEEHCAHLPRRCATTDVVMRGSVRGAPELASGEASNYVEQLRGDKAIKVLFDEITLTSISRSSADRPAQHSSCSSNSKGRKNNGHLSTNR
jgi:hypothetical protein